MNVWYALLPLTALFVAGAVVYEEWDGGAAYALRRGLGTLVALGVLVAVSAPLYALFL